ncbi:hypothetical protein O9992_09020 [Vibrio lentus]|nr:hypothetical protein [Vibrio lentus]
MQSSAATYTAIEKARCQKAVSHNAGKIRPSKTRIPSSATRDRWELLVEARATAKDAMYERVNRQHHTRDEYVELLKSKKTMVYTAP